MYSPTPDVVSGTCSKGPTEACGPPSRRCSMATFLADTTPSTDANSFIAALPTPSRRGLYEISVLPAGLVTVKPETAGSVVGSGAGAQFTTPSWTRQISELPASASMRRAVTEVEPSAPVVRSATCSCVVPQIESGRS